MSYKIIQRISIRDDIVYAVLASSDTSPLRFQEEEQPALTEQFREGGMHAMLNLLGQDMFRGTIFMRPYNCALAEHLKRAGELLKPPLSFALDAEHAGEFIATVAEGFQNDSMYTPFRHLKELDAVRSDPEEMLSICKNNPKAFNFAESNVRKDRDVAMRYINQCISDFRFTFPSYFANDKEMALSVLRRHGHYFGQLDKELRGDKEVVLTAFTRKSHLNNNAFDASAISENLLADEDFMCELLRVCPALRLDRVKHVLNNPTIAATWIRANANALNSMHLLPFSAFKEPKVISAISIRSFKDPEVISIAKRAATPVVPSAGDINAGTLYVSQEPPVSSLQERLDNASMRQKLSAEQCSGSLSNPKEPALSVAR